MKHTVQTRTKVIAFASALLIGAGAAGTAIAAPDGEAPAERPRLAAALTGEAKLFRSLGDDITFTFDARLAAKDTKNPRKATGTFSFSHYRDGRGAKATARVDCLVTGGKVAVVTGIITESDLPGGRGKRVGVTVHDTGGTDRLGYSWAAGSISSMDVPPCVSSAPYEKVKEGTGDFTVVPWRPAL
ncbi:Repetin [Streptomyces sp. NPDC057638]|uniref:Repetin n=1 Tax=Streptomyces sp. NPDC057638 TaxID=3346190 RepID=UPI0036ADD11E